MRRLVLAVLLCVALVVPAASFAKPVDATAFNAMNASQKAAFVKKYLPRKAVLSLFASGEVASFAHDGRLLVTWGLDYAGPNDTRPRGGVGSWSIDDGKLVLAKTALSDGAYPIGEFIAFAYKRKMVLYTCGSHGPFFGVPPAWWRSLDNAEFLALGERGEAVCE